MSRFRARHIGHAVGKTMIFLSLSLVIGYGFWLVFFGSFQSNLDDLLYIPPQSLEIGNVWAQEQFECSLPVKNITRNPVTVKGISASCACITKVEPNRFSVGPNQIIVLRLVIDLNSLLLPTSEKSEKPFRLSFFPEIAGYSPKLDQWEIKGQIIRPYFVTKAPTSDNSFVAGMPVPPYSLSIVCHDLIHHLELSESNLAHGRVTMKMVPTIKNQYILMFFPKASLPVGTHNICINLLAIDTKGQKRKIRPVRFPITVYPDLQIRPTHLSLGIVEINKECLCSLQVNSHTKKRLRGFSNEVDDDGVGVRNVSTSSIPASPNYHVKIGITPLKPGVCSSKVMIKAQCQEGAFLPSVPLYVSYIGEYPKKGCP